MKRPSSLQNGQNWYLEHILTEKLRSNATSIHTDMVPGLFIVLFFVPLQQQQIHFKLLRFIFRKSVLWESLFPIHLKPNLSQRLTKPLMTGRFSNSAEANILEKGWSVPCSIYRFDNNLHKVRQVWESLSYLCEWKYCAIPDKFNFIWASSSSSTSS